MSNLGGGTLTSAKPTVPRLRVSGERQPCRLPTRRWRCRARISVYPPPPELKSLPEFADSEINASFGKPSMP